MMGRIGGDVGATPVEPDVAMLSLGKAVHAILNALLDSLATTSIDWSWAMVIGPPLAVKGPILMGADGRLSASPEDGTGFGMGRSNPIDPVGTCGGVAP